MNWGKIDNNWQITLNKNKTGQKTKHTCEKFRDRMKF
jgi:hypothetical protein